MKKLYITAAVAAMLMLSGCNNSVTTSGTNVQTPEATTVAETQKADEATKAPETDKEEKSDKEIIPAGESNSKDGFVKTFSNAYDVTGDGIKDNISLYVKAESDQDGTLLTEDSHEWFLEVSDGVSTYTLYKGKISLGNAYAEISEYYEGEKAVPVISLIRSSQMGLSVTNYVYNNEKKGFEKDDVFTTDKLSSDGVNKIASSLPEAKAIK